MVSELHPASWGHMGSRRWTALLNPDTAKHSHDKHNFFPLIISSWAIWTMHKLETHQGEESSSKGDTFALLSLLASSKAYHKCRWICRKWGHAVTSHHMSLWPGVFNPSSKSCKWELEVFPLSVYQWLIVQVYLHRTEESSLRIFLLNK